MVYRRFLGPYVAAVFAALFAIVVFLLFTVPVSAASATCSWGSQTSITCSSETFTQTSTNGNTMTLTGNSSSDGCSGTDTLVVDNYTTAKSAKLTLFNTSCASTTSAVSLSGNYSKLATTCSDGGSPVNGSCPAQDGSSCGGGGFDWAICPADNLFESLAQDLLNFITSIMNINTSGSSGIFGNGPTSHAYYRAWNTFRILGTGVIIIAGLVTVGAQAFGLEMLDAYTIRKILPRLLVAVIGMSLSWPILNFVITFFNVFGKDIQNLMYAPFSTLPNHAQLTDGIVSWGFVGIVATLMALKFGSVLLPILGIGALDLLVAVFVLVIRQVAVTALVISAPFAVAAYVLPNTKKIWDFWRDNFLGLMFMYPIITMLIAAGQIFSAVGKSGGSAQQIVGIIAFYVPYFLIPFAFRMATGIISNISGWMHDRRKTMRGRLQGLAGGLAGKRLEDIHGYNAYKGGVEGEHGNMRGRVNKFLGRAANINQAGLNPLRMGGNMRGFEARHSMNAAAEFREKNESFRMFSGNEDYLNASLDSHGNEHKLRQHLKAYQDVDKVTGKVTSRYDDATINQVVAQVRNARQNVADDIFEKSAVLGLAATGTGLATQFDAQGNIIGGGAGEQNRRINEVWGADRLGAVSGLVAARSLNSGARRFDISGGGTGAAISTLEAQYKGKVTEGDATQTTIKQALEGQGGSYVAGSRKGAVESFAPVMFDRLKVQFKANGGNVDETGLARELAKIAGRYDAMAQVAPENAEVMANNVLSKTIADAGNDPRFKNADGSMMTVRQMIDSYRDNHQFLEMRREYNASARQGATDAAQAAAVAQLQAQQLGNPQAGGPVPPILGGPLPPVMGP
jgi:hypothetical protein